MVRINGTSPTKAIETLNNICSNWFSDYRESLNIESQDDIDVVYEIMIDFAEAFVKGKLTDDEINEIDKYYRKWYGYSIREED